MKIFFEVGLLMYLGFLIYVCLYFVIILINMKKCVFDGDGDLLNLSYMLFCLLIGIILDYFGVD